MSDKKHTPGPWALMGDDHVVRVDGPCTFSVAKVHYHHDAKLIVAAPDLYGALEAAVAGWDDKLGEGDEYPTWLAAVRAALAKVQS